MIAFLLILLSWAIAIAVSLPLAVLATQSLVAMFPARPLPEGRRRRVAVLIPAHDEAVLIGGTLSKIRPQLGEGDRLVVVADNCGDATPHIAESEGAEVVVRHDLERRGKGFALDAGVDKLIDDPPDVVIILDADCSAEPGVVDRLASAVDGCQRPVQARYLMRAPRDPGPESLVSAFAFLFKNWVRPRAMQRLGLPVGLTGTGMAFPWPVIRDANLANEEIVEDLALGITLMRQGVGPRFCEEAHVWSDLPSDPAGSVSQRTRWEHGFLHTMMKQVPRLILDTIKGQPALIFAACDLMVPPLSLLVLLSATAVVTLAALAVATQVWLPFGVLLGISLLAAIGIVTSWVRFARDLIPFRAIRSIPRYVLAKAPIYRRFFRQRETTWVRTSRDVKDSDR